MMQKNDAWICQTFFTCIYLNKGIHADLRNNHTTIISNKRVTKEKLLKRKQQIKEDEKILVIVLSGFHKDGQIRI